MALTTSYPGPSGVVDSTMLRKDLAGLIVRDSTGAPRAGVFPRGTAAVVTARASMGVDVGPFEAALVRGGGPLFIQNDGTVTVTVGAAPSSNSRIDVVYVKQNEAASADANDSPVFGVVAGTAAASPTAPAVPTGALPLAQILIPSTASTTQSSGVVITQAFPYTAATGGTIIFRNVAERNAFSAGEGHRSRLLTTDVDSTFDGSTWAQEEGLFGLGGTLVGGVPAAGMRLLRQEFLGAATTNASGDASITYPVTFPNGVISASLVRHNFATLGATFEILNTTQSTSQLNFRIFSASGAAITSVATFGYSVRVTGW